MFRRLRSCFNIYLEFISARFSQFCCLWPTRLDRVRISRRADPGVFVANRAAIPQRGQLNVITAHFKPAENFKTIKQVFLLYYHVPFLNKNVQEIKYRRHRHVAMLLWDL